MKKNHTEITIVLDRSGSMQNVAGDTIGGFNKFLEDQKKAPGTATITLNQFDDVFETILNAVDIQKATNLDGTTFVPRGTTALLDAIGRSITDTGKRLESLPENERAEKVVFVIITDGYENASHEYSNAKINEMIKHQRDNYAWEFVFLGANQDAIASGARMGIAHTHSHTYANNTQGVHAAYASVSSNLTQMRSLSKSSMAFTDDDRKAQKKAGVK